ncbi:uncharacterized protein CIMG_13765 [Coccidioides immitis RS]|uniref:Uncharacterized protein n=1 Tax=Coccidioides immitis (strain RS) TaxID=246410 RepID=A0A0D8JWB5_COCIM|nr:uncharacterized protein CIMG_13765 [Coccidioides immitis RS]KJF61600.1 hypothetical protein CIMG_13765 [Coccidioides immitis RS]
MHFHPAVCFTVAAVGNQDHPATKSLLKITSTELAVFSSHWREALSRTSHGPQNKTRLDLPQHGFAYQMGRGGSLQSSDHDRAFTRNVTGNFAQPDCHLSGAELFPSAGAKFLQQHMYSSRTACLEPSFGCVRRAWCEHIVKSDGEEHQTARSNLHLCRNLSIWNHQRLEVWGFLIDLTNPILDS